MSTEIPPMPRFTMDNTKGYTQAQLDELSDRFEGMRQRLEHTLGRELSSPAETGRCIGRSAVFGAAGTGDGRTIEDQG